MTTFAQPRARGVAVLLAALTLASATPTAAAAVAAAARRRRNRASRRDANVPVQTGDESVFELSYVIQS